MIWGSVRGGVMCVFVGVFVCATHCCVFVQPLT